MKTETFAGDVIKGAVAGAVATWVMGKATTWFWEHESAASQAKYKEVTGEKYVPDRAAEKLENLVGLHPSKEQHQTLAQANHWAIGIGAGIAYSLLKRQNNMVSAGRGLLFGEAFSVLFDEGLTVVTGLAELPQKYSWQAHARGLFGHLVYGVIADATLSVLENTNYEHNYCSERNDGRHERLDAALLRRRSLTSGSPRRFNRENVEVTRDMAKTTNESFWSKHIDKLGIGGSLFAALCCLGFPALLSILSAIGLGFVVNDAILIPLLILFLLVTLGGLYLGVRHHGSWLALIVGTTSAIATFVSIAVAGSKMIAGIGIAGLVVAGVLNVWLQSKKGR